MTPRSRAASGPGGTPATNSWPSWTRAEFRQSHRLIPATYSDSTQPFLQDLVAPDSEDVDEDIGMLTELSAVTNTRLLAQRGRSNLNLGAHELVFDVDYSQIVNGAFAYPGQGARFHDETRGAWYATTEVSTCLAEVAHHKTQVLAEIGLFEDQVEYIDFVCDIGGQHFADLRDGSEASAQCLDPDSYVRSQLFAAEVLEVGGAGVIWPSVRDPDGTCVVCFRPTLLPPLSRGARWRLEWHGDPTPEVVELPSSQ